MHKPSQAMSKEELVIQTYSNVSAVGNSSSHFIRIASVPGICGTQSFEMIFWPFSPPKYSGLWAIDKALVEKFGC